MSEVLILSFFMILS